MSPITHCFCQLYAYFKRLLLQVKGYLRQSNRGKARHLRRPGNTATANPEEPSPHTRPHRTRFQPKPIWVQREVIRLSAIMPNDGGQRIADTFNRLYAKSKRMTVGKTWVCEQRRKHRYAILQLRREIKHQKPRRIPVNHTWAMDITGLPDTGGQSHPVLGILDHGSRHLFCLKKLQTKASIALLRALLDVIEYTHRKPKRIRTDNEAIFVSRLFRFGLWWLGIRHQRTDKGCPWMNGRIERLFGTLKRKAKGFRFAVDTLPYHLAQFQFWYNHLRPHQNLGGRTPNEAYCGLSITEIAGYESDPEWFEAWHGRLAGYWFKPG